MQLQHAQAVISILRDALPHTSDNAVKPVLNAVHELYQWSIQSRGNVPVRLRLRKTREGAHDLGDLGVEERIASVRVRLRLKKPRGGIKVAEDACGSDTSTQSPNVRCAADVVKTLTERLSDASTLPPTPTATVLENQTATSAGKRRGSDVHDASSDRNRKRRASGLSRNSLTGTPRCKHVPSERNTASGDGKATRHSFDLFVSPQGNKGVRAASLSPVQTLSRRPSSQNRKMASPSKDVKPAPPKKRKRARSINSCEDDIKTASTCSPQDNLPVLQPIPIPGSPPKLRRKKTRKRARVSPKSVDSSADAADPVLSDSAPSVAKNKALSTNIAKPSSGTGDEAEKHVLRENECDRILPDKSKLLASDGSNNLAQQPEDICYITETMPESHPDSIVETTQPPPFIVRLPASAGTDSMGSTQRQRRANTETIESRDFVDETPHQMPPNTQSTQRETIDYTEKVMRQPSFDTTSQQCPEGEPNRDEHADEANNNSSRIAEKSKTDASLLTVDAREGKAATPTSLRAKAAETPSNAVLFKPEEPKVSSDSGDKKQDGASCFNSQTRQEREKLKSDTTPRQLFNVSDVQEDAKEKQITRTKKDEITAKQKILETKKSVYELPGRISPVAIDDAHHVSKATKKEQEKGSAPDKEGPDENEYNEMKVCISGIPKGSQCNLAYALVMRLGGEIVEDFRNGGPQYVVVPIDAQTNDVSGRSMEVQYALASGTPLVGMQWLVQCFKTGMWLGTSPFEAICCKRRGGINLFQGVVATFEEPVGKRHFRKHVRELFQDLERLITAAGGIVATRKSLQSITARARGSLNLHVHIANDVDQSASQRMQKTAVQMQQMKAVQMQLPTEVVGANWVSDCLISGQCPQQTNSEESVRTNMTHPQTES